jgi:hypothetical protein
MLEEKGKEMTTINKQLNSFGWRGKWKKQAELQESK